MLSVTLTSEPMAVKMSSVCFVSCGQGKNVIGFIKMRPHIPETGENMPPKGLDN